MTEALIFTASPVFTIDGEDRGELARDVVFLQVQESVDGLKRLEARFVAVGPEEAGQEERLLYLDGRTLDFGKAVKIAIGPPDEQRTIFEGLISAIEINYDEGEEPEICILAEDRLMDLRMTRRMKTYEDMSDADIASEIASEHGLAPAVDAEGPTYDRIQQCNMSDLAFLRERARLLQAEVWYDADSLHFKTRDKRDGTDITLIRGNDIITVRACADLAEQRTSVKVSGYDANARELIEEEAGEEAVAGEAGSGRTGCSILQTAFGERVSRRVREVPLDGAEAADWAGAEMRRRARRFLTVNAVTRGTPDLVVGSRVSLENMGGPFSGGGFYVTRVRHTYDLAQGHRTHFEAERPTLGAFAMA